MNEQIIKNIALCYADTEKNQIEVMLSFAKLLMTKDVNRLFYLNDYLEAGLEVSHKEPYVRTILRNILEEYIDEPGVLLKHIAENDVIENKNGIIDRIHENMIHRGYYEDCAAYVCPSCGKEMPLSEISTGICMHCSAEIVKQIENIRHLRRFKDYFIGEMPFQEKRYSGKNKKINPEPPVEDYKLPEPYRKEEDNRENPFFAKRVK